MAEGRNVKKPGIEKIVVVAGTGVQMGSWEPIFAALAALGFPGASCADTANTALASIVQDRRLAHARMSDGAPSPARERADARYQRLVSEIRERLAAARDDGGIAVREDFERVWDDAAVGPAIDRGTAIHAVTTNWDDVFLRKLEEHAGGTLAKECHLHGGLRSQGPMLLPSESAIEPYRPQDSDDAQSLLGRRQLVVNILEEADQLLLWGLALHALDAELMQAIVVGLFGGNPRVRRVTIVNPDHRTVARRLMALAPSDWDVKDLPELVGSLPGEECMYAWPR